MLPWQKALEPTTLKKHGRRLPSTAKVNKFVTVLISWYRSEGRSFRWRRSHVPVYEATITECLLQRTRAETVHEFVPKFLSRFPTWRALAKAEVPELEQFLKPIGLQKRRAVSLNALAKSIERLGYRLPASDQQLFDLPMFGQYVLNSIQLYRFNLPRPLLDVSMARLLERYFGHRDLADIRYDPFLQQLARKVVLAAPQRKIKQINWALLDFAALTCCKKPLCNKCPVYSGCQFFRLLSPKDKTWR